MDKIDKKVSKDQKMEQKSNPKWSKDHHDIGCICTYTYVYKRIIVNNHKYETCELCVQNTHISYSICAS